MFLSPFMALTGNPLHAGKSRHHYLIYYRHFLRLSLEMQSTYADRSNFTIGLGSSIWGLRNGHLVQLLTRLN